MAPSMSFPAVPALAAFATSSSKSCHQPESPVIPQNPSPKLPSSCPHPLSHTAVIPPLTSISSAASCPFAGTSYPITPDAAMPEQQQLQQQPSETPETPASDKSTQQPKSSSLGVSEAGRGSLYYPDYLKLEKLLSCQEPVSFQRGNPCHDEMLFITIHQAYELWFKQLIFEMDSVRNILAELNIGEKRISLALHRLTRIREIQKLLNDQIRVLETMTPQEFLEFRDYLFPASGFQSFQFRLLEIKLGVSPEQRLNSSWIRKIHPKHQEMLREAQQQPSLFDYVERWLRNIPFREYRGYSFQKSYETAIEQMFAIERENINTRLPEEQRPELLQQLDRTFRTFQSVYQREVHEEMVRTRQRRMGFRSTATSLMIMLYQDEPMFQLPARLLHMLVNVDEQMSQWRYRHSQMVHRMIGAKIGTGGSLGHGYLKRTIDSQKVFSDLANMSTLLIPRRLLPPLPAELSDQMKYFHSIEKLDRTMFEMGGGGDEIDWSFC